MIFDIRTILFLLFLVSGLLSLMLVLYWKTERTYDGFSIWTFASVLSSLAYLLILLRGSIPGLISIVLANVLVIQSVLMRADSMARFTGSRKFPPWIYASLVPVAALLLIFTYAVDSVPVRGLITSAVIVPGLLFLALILLSYGKTQDRYICSSLAAVLAGYALLYLLRTADWLLFIRPITVFSADEINSIFFTITLLLDILATGIFLMLNMSRARADVAASEARYRTLSENLPEYIVVHDGRRILYANPASVKVTGVRDDRMTGMAIDDFISPRDRERTAALLKNIRTDPVAAAKPHEIVIRTPDGTDHICIVRSVTVQFQGIPAVLSVLTDITERKQVEDALQMSNRKLNLLSGITRHDIRNQLLILGSYLELSKASLDNPAAMAEFIGKEKKVVQNIAHQINFSKDYEDLGVRAPAWQDISRLIGEVKTRLPLGKITVATDDCGIEVFADPLLEKVFYNLFDNALNYGGEKLSTIRISCHDVEGGLIVAVEDDGVGIPREEKQKIFEKGFGKHTGLGLFLSREILSITNITIAETGEPGTGARFEILVPKGQYRTIS